MAITELDQMKQGARATWAAGDYPAIAQRQLWPLGERIVGRIGVRAGRGRARRRLRHRQRRPPRRAGRRRGWSASTSRPELLDEGRRLAGEAGLDIEFVEGDAEALPVADARFDVVVSVMGCMFAPRHRVAAAELARVLRPGGRLCVTGWAPDGAMGTMFKTLGSHLPAPPPFAESPLGWGSEDHVRELFEGSGVELEFAREQSPFAPFDSIDDEIAFTTAKFGPLIMARRMLEPAGRWQALLDDLRAFAETRPPTAEYLVTTGRKLGGDA